MVWSRKAKIDFYWKRRRQATKKYVEAATLLGTSIRRAKIKARKDFTIQFRIYRLNTKKLNRTTRQIERLNKKGALSAEDARQLQRLEARENRLVAKIHRQWDTYMIKIGFKPVGDEDERSQRNTP